MKTKGCLAIFTGMMLWCLVGCAVNNSFVKTGFQILAVGQQSYDVAMKSLVDLHEQGNIPDDTFNEALEIAKTYHDAHNTAVELLAQYKESGEIAYQESFEEKLKLSCDLLSRLLELVKRGDIHG
jgi:hypothetical protein